MRTGYLKPSNICAKNQRYKMIKKSSCSCVTKLIRDQNRKKGRKSTSFSQFLRKRISRAATHSSLQSTPDNKKSKTSPRGFSSNVSSVNDQFCFLKNKSWSILSKRYCRNKLTSRREISISIQVFRARRAKTSISYSIKKSAAKSQCKKSEISI